jgi:hypothetical protein
MPPTLVLKGRVLGNQDQRPHPRLGRCRVLRDSRRWQRLSPEVRPQYPGAVTLSGHLGDDAKPYQKKQVRRAIEEVQR